MADLTEIRLIRSNSHVADIPQTMKSNQQFVIECCNIAPVQPVNEKVHTEASQQGNASYRRESNW